MNELLHDTASDTLDYLLALSRHGVRPQEARARLGSLRERHPDTNIELVWEEEAYDGSTHYDALLHVPGEGTVSLSFCPERGLPWPLRGVHRWSEADLVRVNATVLQVEQAIGSLDFLWEDRRLTDRLVNVCLIQEALEQDPVCLTDEELQQAVDGFRRAHGLYTAGETYRWMERRGMTHAQLEKYAADEAIVARLRDRVTADQVDEYFEAHRADFDSARIARITFADEESAARAYHEIQAGEIGVYDVAQRRFLEADGRRDGPAISPFAVIRRGQAPAALADAVFAAAPSEIVGPVHTDEGYAVVQVLDLAPACLDERTRRAITVLLFDEWLEERRRTARVEWFWGSANRTERGEPGKAG